jgi:hypothetical protein
MKLKQLLFSQWFDIACMSLLFMWLMPFGSFNVNDLGFYISIVQALLTSFTTRHLLKKYQKDYMGKIK